MSQGLDFGYTAFSIMLSHHQGIIHVEAQFMPFAVFTLRQNLLFIFHHLLIIRFIFTLISGPDYSSIEFQTIIYKQYDADIRNL